MTPAPLFAVELSDADVASALAGTLPGLEDELREALAEAAEPVVRLALQRGDRAGEGWVGPGWAVVSLPAGAGRRIVAAPTEFLPDALARLFELGPRPRPEPAVRVRVNAGVLAASLAARDATAVPGVGERAAFERLVSGLRAHWRVEARWPPARESTGLRVVEVLDSSAGAWLVIPDGADVELWPSTPSVVFRELCGLLPRPDELAAGG